MRNSCKFARDYHAKLPASGGKYTCNLQAKTLESQVKITANAGKNTRTIAGKKNLQFQAELSAIAGNLLSHRG